MMRTANTFVWLLAGCTAILLALVVIGEMAR